MDQSDASRQKRATRTIAERVRTERKAKGWSAERLAEEMSKIGFDWQRGVVAKLESGQREQVSVDEWLGLAHVLDVAPVHLVVPLDDDNASYAYVPVASVRAGRVRAWIRGDYPMSDNDPRRYFSVVPRREWVPPGPPNDREEERRLNWEVDNAGVDHVRPSDPTGSKDSNG